MKRALTLAVLATSTAVFLSACASLRSDPPTCPDDAASATMARQYAALQPMATPMAWISSIRTAAFRLY